jgi:hypothetical protein
MIEQQVADQDYKTQDQRHDKLPKTKGYLE